MFCVVFIESLILKMLYWTESLDWMIDVQVKCLLPKLLCRHSSTVFNECSASQSHSRLLYALLCCQRSMLVPEKRLSFQLG